MTENIPYFVRGHTAEGLVNYLESNLQGINQIITLQHDNKQFIADILRLIIEQEKNESIIEEIYSPYLTKDLEGIIDKTTSLAILDKDVLPNGEMVNVKIDLNEWLPVQIDEETKQKQVQLEEEAYRLIKEALTIHDRLEQIYIDEMNFSKANKVANNIIQEMFAQVPINNRKGRVVERLFGTNTIDGAVNEVEQLIKPIKNRVFVKGRAGTGKSVLLKKVLNKSIEHGYDVELYRCSFDPESIDMVIIRGLDYCLFDSTSPHEFFPTRITDQVIDLYETTVTTGTDDKYEKSIKQTTDAYKRKMKTGLEKIKALANLAMFKRPMLTGDNYYEIINDILKKVNKVSKKSTK